MLCNFDPRGSLRRRWLGMTPISINVRRLVLKLFFGRESVWFVFLDYPLNKKVSEGHFFYIYRITINMLYCHFILNFIKKTMFAYIRLK